MKKITEQTYVHLLFWLAAFLTGCIAIAYAKIIELSLQQYHQHATDYPIYFLFATPALFMLAAFFVKKFSPGAAGSGIPQILRAIQLSSSASSSAKDINKYVSIRTMLIKILSSVTGILGGASIGREGPTVQIASSIFAYVGNMAKKRGIEIDLRSFLIAGGSAGVAAAFNTPLAGITFAIEEIAESFFPEFKQDVMISVIIAGITAQAIIGDYLYFGHPLTAKPTLVIVPEALLIGAIGGITGGIFAYILSAKKINKYLPSKWWVRALVCGIICALIGFTSSYESSGAGYEAVRKFMDTPSISFSPLFALGKYITTIASYLSGMAGGIFSPCLSIGAGLGYTVGALLSFSNLKVCALIGMVSFFSGAVQAPLTSVVIVMEMTDEHILIIPFMIAAYLSHALSKRFMPVPLYRKLAGHYQDELSQAP